MYIILCIYSMIVLTTDFPPRIRFDDYYFWFHVDVKLQMMCLTGKPSTRANYNVQITLYIFIFLLLFFKNECTCIHTYLIIILYRNIVFLWSYSFISVFRMIFCCFYIGICNVLIVMSDRTWLSWCKEKRLQKGHLNVKLSRCLKICLYVTSV